MKRNATAYHGLTGRCCAASRSGEYGFTLVELIISIALTGIIAVIITGAMKLSFDSVEKGEKRINALEIYRASLRNIDSQIQSQIPLTFDDDGEKRFYFHGSGQELTIATALSLWDADRGYVVVTYSVETDARGKQLLRATEKVIGTDKTRDTRLFRDLDAIHFRYYYKDPAAEEGTWVEEWTDPLSIPEKVMLSLDDGQREYLLRIPVRSSSARFGSQGLSGGSPWVDIKKLRNPW